jgi:curli production assembly/transport component CsgG/holdfast attachment protein HfaB
MTRRGRKHLLKPLVFILAAVALEGCISPTPDSVGRYTSPIGGAPVISNETAYSAALRCMGGIVAQHPVRIAVGQIADYTGKTESDGSGKKLTNGAALMAMSALSKANVHMVERFDTSVAEMELKYANNKLIANDMNPQSGDYRKIIAGAIPGSDYYIVGGITELNFNIRSENASGNGGGTATTATTGTLGGSLYVMNVGLDMRLINTNTLEVADVISYQKQIVGRQITAGVFDFLGTNFFDVSGGESALEPIQLAVRSVIERAVLEMVTRIYRAPGGTCASPIGTAADPLADARPYPYQAYAQPYPYMPAAYQQQPYPYQQPYNPTYAYNQENYNEASRQNPYRGYGSSDPVGDVRLRAGY